MEAFASITGHKGSLRQRFAFRAFRDVYQQTSDLFIRRKFDYARAAECQALGSYSMISVI